MVYGFIRLITCTKNEKKTKQHLLKERFSKKILKRAFDKQKKVQQVLCKRISKHKTKEKNVARLVKKLRNANAKLGQELGLQTKLSQEIVLAVEEVRSENAMLLQQTDLQRKQIEFIINYDPRKAKFLPICALICTLFLMQIKELFELNKSLEYVTGLPSTNMVWDFFSRRADVFEKWFEWQQRYNYQFFMPFWKNSSSQSITCWLNAIGWNVAHYEKYLECGISYREVYDKILSKKTQSLFVVICKERLCDMIQHVSLVANDHGNIKQMHSWGVHGPDSKDVLERKVTQIFHVELMVVKKCASRSPSPASTICYDSP
jgi:hypothetical protein